ncbi:hypothetical protein ABKA04_003732 [Annulohypoxylon sp. FPYF3050]
MSLFNRTISRSNEIEKSQTLRTAVGELLTVYNADVTTSAAEGMQPLEDLDLDALGNVIAGKVVAALIGNKETKCICYEHVSGDYIIQWETTGFEGEDTFNSFAAWEWQDLLQSALIALRNHQAHEVTITLKTDRFPPELDDLHYLIFVTFSPRTTGTEE